LGGKAASRVEGPDMVDRIFQRKELQAFVAGCESLISSSRFDKDLQKDECNVVQFYLSELLTLIKKN
jgi:hypothetical protein